MCWLSARSASGENAGGDSLVGSGRRKPPLHFRMSGPFCCSLASLKDPEPAPRPARGVRRLRRVPCRPVLLARPGYGEAQRVGQFPAVTGADRPGSSAVRGCREFDGNVPGALRLYRDEPGNVAGLVRSLRPLHGSARYIEGVVPQGHVAQAELLAELDREGELGPSKVSRVNYSCRSCCLIQKCYRYFSTRRAMPQRENSPSNRGNPSSAPSASSSPNSRRPAACSYSPASYPSGSMAW